MQSILFYLFIFILDIVPKICHFIPFKEEEYHIKMALVDNIWPDVISLPRDIWFRRIKSYFIYEKKRKEFKGQSRFFKVKVCQSLLGCYNNIFHNNISQLMI